MMSPPVGYFITFTTYGTWLHGRSTGSVDRRNNAPGMPFLPPDETVEHEMRRKLRQPPYILDLQRRSSVLTTFQEVASHRGWQLLAVHVRSNHVHVVLTADAKPEKVMVDFKAWTSRRIREQFGEPIDRERWTRHGSTRYLNDDESLNAALDYIVSGQGDPMAVYDSRVHNEPKA